MPLDQLCPCTAIPIKPTEKQEEDSRAYQQFLSLVSEQSGFKRGLIFPEANALKSK